MWPKSPLIIQSLFVLYCYAGLARRSTARIRNSAPCARILPVTGLSDSYSSNSSHVTYSSNWAGAVHASPPAGSRFNSVTAQLTVPSLSGNGAASAWVGIDGDTYTVAILQAGIDFTMTNTGPIYSAWYEWYPDYSHDFSGIQISSGNIMKISVISTTPNTGTAIVENLSTGKKSSININAPSENSHLKGQNAEWIVEDFQLNGAQVPFTNFGTINFINSKATTSTGSSLDTSGAQLFDLKQGVTVLTTSSALGSSITVKHN